LRGTRSKTGRNEIEMPFKRIPLSKRIRIINMALENCSVRHIAKEVNVSTKTVQKYTEPTEALTTVLEELHAHIPTKLAKYITTVLEKHIEEEGL